MDVRTILRTSVGFHADRVAASCDGRSLTFAEAWDRGLRQADALAQLGVRAQNSVAVLEENSLASVDLYCGAAAANLVRVPLYARNARQSHIAMLRNTDARVLIVDAKLAHEVEGVLDEVETLEHVVVRDDGYEDWLAAHQAVDPDPVIDPDDLCIIRHTGGTTGLPKAVAITHHRWISTGRDWFYPFPAPAPGDPIMHVGPLSHASGYLLLPVWAAGGSQVLVAGKQPDEVIDLMERERIAYAFLPPTLLGAVCRTEGAASRDWSALKVCFTAAAPVSEATIAAARETFGDERLWQMFGQTEAMPVAGMGPQEWFATPEGSQPLRACGRVLPWVELEIRDEENRPLPIGEEGEIAVRCEGQMAGFHKAPEDTAARLVDGWVLMGDIGRVDRNGYLYLLDRKNDMICSGAFNIYPGELENAIASHPEVLDVAVFGIPHEKWGETPMAVCVVDDGAAVAPQDIIDLVSERLGSYMKPSRVELTTEPLPRSAVGKLLRRALRAPHWEGQERRISGA